MKTNERTKKGTDSKRREHESPMQQDKPEQMRKDPMPDPRESTPGRVGPMDRRAGSPRERSDEDAIARPVQLDEADEVNELEDELDEEREDFDEMEPRAGDERSRQRPAR